ncbi:MAG: 30S ribosomal protein S15 [Candidatus Hadarchaeia archaeon]
MAKKPDWVEKNPEEIEELILELADKGHPPAEIGALLRDRYGIPEVRDMLGESILSVLESNGKAPEIPEDLMNLLRNSVELRDHLDRNPNDVRAKRELNELESNIQKIAKYYKRKDRLSDDWRYEPEEAALLVRG